MNMPDPNSTTTTLTANGSNRNPPSTVQYLPPSAINSNNGQQPKHVHYGNHVVQSSTSIQSTITSSSSNNNNDDPIRYAVSAAAAIARVQSEAPRAAGVETAPTTQPTTVVPAPATSTRYQHPHQHPSPRRIPPVPIVPMAPLHWQSNAGAKPFPASIPPAPPPPPPHSNNVMIFNGPQGPHPIFGNRKLRSGKWTTEEEAYAECLIGLFEKGHIDEKNGCTLRSFLSRKLHCPPMRISKKYAGKGIGKMVFLSKVNMTSVDGYGSVAYHESMKKLREAESAFFKTVFPGLAMPFPQPGHFIWPPPQTSNGLAPIVPAPVSLPSQVSVTHHAQRGQIATCHVVMYPAWSQGVQQFVPVQTHQPALQGQNVVHQPIQHPAQASVGASNKSNQISIDSATHTNETKKESNSAAATKQSRSLEHVYFSAANYVMQATCNSEVATQTPLAPPSCEKATAVASQEAKNLQQVFENNVSGTPSISSDSNIPKSTLSATNAEDVRINPEPVASRSHSTAKNATEAVAAATAIDSNTRRRSFLQVSANLPKPNKSEVPVTNNPPLCDKAHATSAKSASVPNLNEMPDFLSAFDKISGRSCPTPFAHNYATGNQLSPTFTSKSFDDLHQFLGKGLSPLAPTTNLANKVSISRNGMPVIPDKIPEQPEPAEGPKLDPKPSSEHVFQPRQTSENTVAKKDGDPSKPSYTSLLSEAYSEAIGLKMKSEAAPPGPICADSYNLFAQQSAVAARQHGAYMIEVEEKKGGGSGGDNIPRKQVPTLELPPSVQNGTVSSGLTQNSYGIGGEANALVQEPSRLQSFQVSQLDALQSMYQGGLSQNLNRNINDRKKIDPNASSSLLTRILNPNAVSEPSNSSSNASSDQGYNTGSQTASSDTTLNYSSSSNDSDESSSDTPITTTSYNKRPRISYTSAVGNKRAKRDSPKEEARGDL